MSRCRMFGVCVFAALTVSVAASPVFAQDAVAEAATEPEDDVRPQMKDVIDEEGERGGGIVVSDNVVEDDDEEEPAGWTVEFFGYVRTQYTSIQNDPDYAAIGRHDGFSIADARLGFLGYLDNGIGFELEVDAGVPRPTEEANTAVGEVVTRLKDGYLFYQPHRLLRASAGQFKVPFDIEELISTADILFIERSVGSRGVLGIEGLNRGGLSVGRQVGVRLDSKPYFVLGGDDGPGVSYALAATNGESAERAFNDNDDMAYFGRLNLHWGDIVRLGGGAYYNDRTYGDPEELVGHSEKGWTADVTVGVAGVTLLANIIQTDFEPDAELGAEPARTARSYQAQVAYEEPFFGLQPAYRFSYLDSDTDVEGSDAAPNMESLTYHTIGLNYNAKTYPIRLMLNYTLTGEEAVEIDNDRFDALVQVEW